MYHDFRSIFLKILEGIEYHGDKDKYIKNFYNTIHLTALNNLINKLPTDRKEQRRNLVKKYKIVLKI